MSNPDDMIHLPMQSPRFSRLLSTIDDVVRQHYGDTRRVQLTFVRENGVTRLEEALVREADDVGTDEAE